MLDVIISHEVKVVRISLLADEQLKNERREMKMKMKMKMKTKKTKKMMIMMKTKMKRVMMMMIMNKMKQKTTMKNKPIEITVSTILILGAIVLKLSFDYKLLLFYLLVYLLNFHIHYTISYYREIPLFCPNIDHKLLE